MMKPSLHGVDITQMRSLITYDLFLGIPLSLLWQSYCKILAEFFVYREANNESFQKVALPFLSCKHLYLKILQFITIIYMLKNFKMMVHVFYAFESIYFTTYFLRMRAIYFLKYKNSYS